ncbi:MAG: D-2-hydroxyacid dehydrogenase [Spirochaetia bacterium]|nr:D-2-hydroxyacid dehydrogenase [Spirochaetia bacterium]
MNIVVLDGYTLNPGDLTWEGLQQLGNLTVYDHTDPCDIVQRASEADILLTDSVPLSAETIFKLPELRYIAVMATGYDGIDMQAAAEQEITVCNIPSYGTQSVAQMVIAHMLNFCHHLTEHSFSVKAGDWTESSGYCYWNFPQIELAGLTLGIIGFGRIGQKTADLAQAFGMHILAYDPAVSDQSHRPSFEWASMDQIFSESDFVSLHTPLLPETERIINRSNLVKMKKSAFLINTSRGRLIHEEDLARALREQVIAGAGLDVLSEEPPAADNPLLHAPHCFITPHIAWATRSARTRLMETLVENVSACIAGKPINKVLP